MTLTAVVSVALLSVAILLFAKPSPRAREYTVEGGSTKLVFSWYMTPFYTYSSPTSSDADAIAGYKREIREAQAAGIDGFALYIGAQADLFRNTTNIFEAARELYDANPSRPRFWLYLAPEAGADDSIRELYPGTGTNWIVYFLNAFASHPNYYRYRNCPVLMPFLGLRVDAATSVNQQADWVTHVFTPLRLQGINLFFVPTLFNTDDVTTVGFLGNHTMGLTSWGRQYLGGLSYWTGNTPKNDINGSNAMAEVAKLNNKPYIGSVADAHYWSVNNSASSHVYFEHYGGEGPAQSWTDAIENQDTAWIIETTYNDYTESYVNAVKPSASAISTGYGIESLLKPHAGYRQQAKYYIQWYKAGTPPTIVKDSLFYFYRTHAKDLVPANHVGTQNFNPGAPNDTVPDDLFVTTMLTSPAFLRVTSGTTVTTKMVGAGVQFTRIPFHSGTQTFQVLRNGRTVVSVTGEPVRSAIRAYDFIPTSGFAEASP